MYKRSLQGWAKHLDFMIIDIICLQVAFMLAFVMRHGWSNPYGNPLYRSLAVVLVFVEIFVIIFGRTLKNVLKRGYYVEFAMVIKEICMIELLVTFYLFVSKIGDSYSRKTLLWLGILYVITDYIMHLVWKAYLRKKRKGNIQGNRSLLVVTTESRAEQTLQDLMKHNYDMLYISGVALIDSDKTGKTINGVEVVADARHVVDYVCREWVDEIFICFPDNMICPQEILEQFMEMGVTVHVKLAETVNIVGTKQIVERIGKYVVLTNSINSANVLQLFIKRSMDIIGGAIGCLFTVILTVILAPMIYIQSPGPIFFSQVRIGKNGKKFKIYKFRSMYMDAEERKAKLMEQNDVKDGMMFKMEWDPRIIGCRKLEDGTIKKGIGNFIREWSLDEFPQFFNILKGDMSLVGTRPPTVDEWEKYQLHHRARLAIKPGLTGMWQVSGRSNITDFEDVVKLDLKYISEWTMGMDFRILFKTVAVVLMKDGSR